MENFKGRYKVSVKVIGFYKRKDNKSLFWTIILDPTFYILAQVNGKVRELVLRLSGRYPYYVSSDFTDFEHEAYKNFVVISKVLLGDNGENIRVKWGLTKKEFKELIWGLFLTLLKNSATCGKFRKFILFVSGILKYYVGGKLK